MGIFRKAQTPEQKAQLIDHLTNWGDIEQIEDGFFLIHSGITVLCENYLEGLWQALKHLGAVLITQKIESLDQLSGFDHVVIAAGFGVREIPECAHLKLKYLKGQVLRLSGKPPFEKSFISKGYIAHLGSQKHFELGSTYERDFEDDEPNLKKTKELLSEKLKAYCQDAEITHCRAGVRVASTANYLPIIEKIAENAHVFTGLGSRGLLYHGFFGRSLAQAILSKNVVLS